MRLRSALLVTALLSVAGCFGRPTHPINPPNASIQQLDVLPDGKWKLQTFSVFNPFVDATKPIQPPGT